VPLYFAMHLLVGFLLLLCYAYASSSMQAQMGADNLSAGSTSFFLAVLSRAVNPTHSHLTQRHTRDV